MLLAILVIQEELLVFIPQVQLTVILIIVYAHFLSYKEMVPLVIGYVILDNLIMGSFSLLYTPPMIITWLLLAIVARALRKKPDYALFIVAVLFAFVYGWSFIPSAMLIQSNFNFWIYVKADFIFEMGMAANSVATFLLFYRPLKELFGKLYKKPRNENIETFN